MGAFSDKLLARIRASQAPAGALVYANAAGEVVPPPSGVNAGVDLVTLGGLAWGTEDLSTVEWQPPAEHEDVMCCRHVGKARRVKLAALPRWAKFQAPPDSGINTVGLSRWIGACLDCWTLAKDQAAAVPIQLIVKGKDFRNHTPNGG